MNLKTYKIFKLLSCAIVFFFYDISVNAQISKAPAAKDSYAFKLLPSPPGIPVLDNYTVVKNEFTITLRDGAILDASKFYPDIPNPNLPDGYPCVVMVHGYADSKLTLEHFAQAQAAFNYVVYTYSVRGQGVSGGLSELISKVEAEDLIEFVNFIKQDQSSGLDSSKIIIMGGSQGGTLPYIATSMGMNVKAIISALTSPEFATSWIENGSVKMTMLWSVDYTPDSVRYTSTVASMKNWIYQSGTKNDKWDSLAFYMPLNRDFKDIVSNNQVPVLIENSWQDYFFNTRQAIESLTLVQAPHRVYFGAVQGHGGDISASENQWHETFFNEWFEYYIWGVNNNILTRPKYHYAYTTYPRVNNSWSFIHDSSSVWPPAGVNMKTLYMNTNNRLTDEAADNETLFVSFKNEVTGNLTMSQALSSAFTGTNFNSKFKKDSVYFETQPLTQPLYMVGTPEVVLEYAVNANLCQFNVQLYEVPASGNANFITRINYTDRYYNTNERKKVAIDGKSHAHIFQAGSKLRVVIKNLDWTPQDFKFMTTYPHVLPVLTNSLNNIFLKSTSIKIPVKNGITNITSSNENSFINSFKLFQNYPNPFNPETTIKVNLPMGFSGDVTLKIYDITGKEISSIFSGQLNPGEHNFKFTDNDISTGIYFYQLNAGQYSEVKKMTLIK